MNIIDVIKEYKERRRYHMTNGPEMEVFFRRQGRQIHFYADSKTDVISSIEQEDDASWWAIDDYEMLAADVVADDWEVITYEPGATDPS